MKWKYPLSSEEEEAIESLGGIDRVAAVAQQVLAQNGIHRSLFTPREMAQIRAGRHPRRGAIEFHFDPGKSVRANINDLLGQAGELQETGGGTNYVGAMLQHLVGAKLDIVLGPGKLHHHGFSVADHSTARNSDYQVEAAAIHVTTHPGEALIRKCGDNIKNGLKPVIITLAEAVRPAEFLLKTSGLNERVDVLDAAQFLTANIYERSLFKAAECKITLTALLERYNGIVGECEADQSLLVRLS
jgi:hypothetical protein